MSNYSQILQTNNSSLEEIITQLNNMPDAKDNENTQGVEVTNVTLSHSPTIYYVTSSETTPLSYKAVTLSSSNNVVKIVKGTLFYIGYMIKPSSITPTAGISKIASVSNVGHIYYVKPTAGDEEAVKAVT